MKSGVFLHTLSAFKNTQQSSITVPDSKDPSKFWYTLNGENEYKGIEYSAVGALSDKWDMIFGIAYMDAEKAKLKVEQMMDARFAVSQMEWGLGFDL